MSYKEMYYDSYVTAKAMANKEYMDSLKETLARQTVQAFAEFLHENPDLVQVDTEYDLARNATLVRSRIRVQEWEK